MVFSTMILSVFIGIIKENIMNKEIIIELREHLLDGGWKGFLTVPSFSDQT